MNRRRRTKGPLSPIRLFAIVAIVLLTVVYFITKTRTGTDQPQGEKNSNNGKLAFKIFIDLVRLIDIHFVFIPI
jgi:hypothetical protein